MHKQTFIVAVVPDQYNRTLASSAEAQLLHCMALSNIAGDYRCGFRVLCLGRKLSMETEWLIGGMQIAVRKVKSRQEDVSQKVMGLNPIASE